MFVPKSVVHLDKCTTFSSNRLEKSGQSLSTSWEFAKYTRFCHVLQAVENPEALLHSFLLDVTQLEKNQTRRG